MAKKNIVWLASYPKSGNTWFRIFLSNLRSEQTAPIDINEIRDNGIFSSPKILEIATGLDASHLNKKEIDLVRYGYELFAGIPTTFAPATDIPIPVDYHSAQNTLARITEVLKAHR